MLMSLESDGFYQDPSLPTNQITYQYTLVPAGGLVPLQHRSVELDQLFLFDEDAGDERDGEDIIDPWDPDTTPKLKCVDEFGREYLCLVPDAQRTQEPTKFNRMKQATRRLQTDLGLNLKEVYSEMMRLAGE